MQNITTYRIHVGGRYGSASPNAGEIIPEFAATVEDIVSAQLQGATVLYGTGIWEHETEPVAVIEVVDLPDVNNMPGINTIITTLAEVFQQDSIMLTRSFGEVEFRP